MNPQPEKDVRSRLQETLQRYGIKQVDVARETGTSCLYYQTLKHIFWIDVQEFIIQHYPCGYKER